ARWYLSRGLPPWLPLRGMELMADRDSPITWVLAPLYWLWDSPQALLALQVLALAAGAPATCGLARTCGCTRRAALGFAALYLAQPTLLFTVKFDFHFSALSTPTLLVALWALHAVRAAAY